MRWRTDGIDVAVPVPDRPDALLDVVLVGDSRGSDQVAHQREDREQAVADLRASASFAPGGLTGPFVIRVALDGGRLLRAVRDQARPDPVRPGSAGQALRVFVFSLAPFRRLIKDYQLLVDSQVQALQDRRMHVVQTIDMGRRGLHDEGATLMMERLANRIVIDFDTARRLFTLVCVLHRRI